MADELSPRTPVSSAIIAKVGVAAKQSQSAAPRAAAMPLPWPIPLRECLLVRTSLTSLSSGAAGTAARHSAVPKSRPASASAAILVVAAPPDALLVAPLRRAIEPRIHA